MNPEGEKAGHDIRHPCYDLLIHYPTIHNKRSDNHTQQSTVSESALLHRHRRHYIIVNANEKRLRFTNVKKWDVNKVGTIINDVLVTVRCYL